jgi:hypothetical protein
MDEYNMQYARSTKIVRLHLKQAKKHLKNQKHKLMRSQMIEIEIKTNNIHRDLKSSE